jgi:RimJ/RimL family protein N-acetyltransferase
MLTITSPIVTERLVLRPFTLDDLDDLYAIHSRLDVARYLYWEARDREEVREVLQRKVAQTRLAKQDDALALAITVSGANGTKNGLVGEISLWWRSVENRQGEIGFVLHPDHQGHGFASEAAAAVLDLAFGDLGLHRLYGRTDARNIASAALMQRLGMRQEAHFIHNEVFKGEWGDELLFAILEDEWQTSPTAHYDSRDHLRDSLADD